MSWHFSRALVEAYSEVNCADGKPSARSSSTSMHGMFWSPGRMMDASPRSRSGMMYGLLTEDHGTELLISFLEDFRVRTSVAPEDAPESPERVPGSGLKWRELFVKYSPDSCGWKTARCLWEEDLDWSSLTLPRWGSMHAGELWALAMPEPLTSVIGSGSALRIETFPTPLREDFRRSGPNSKQQGLPEYVHLWPTPVCYDATPGGPNNHYNGLGKMAKFNQWPTPTANEDAAGKPGSRMQVMLGNHPEVRGDGTGGTLNPNWVEWLMGWPIGWTDCAVSAMDRFQQWCVWHGIS